MMKVSAVLVIVLGWSCPAGLGIVGFSLPSMPPGIDSSPKGVGIATIQNGVQIVTTKLQPGGMSQ